MWYRILTLLTKTFGTWLLVAFSRVIALGYFLFSSKTAESSRFYSILYPEKSALFHRRCTFRQYQNFTTIHLDRYLNHQKQPATFTTNGWGQIEQCIGGSGGILLMSHLGNWEIAATLLKEKAANVNLLLYMGEKEKESVERAQKEELRDSGVTIIGVGKEENNPLSAVEGIRFLQEGGLVSLTGDIIWRDDQRKVAVTLFGHTAYVSEAPYIFALVSGAPLYVFFAFRTGKNSYYVQLSEPIHLQCKERAHRQEAIQKAAQQYADLLEEAIRQYPFEWYHFDRFLYTRANEESMVE